MRSLLPRLVLGLARDATDEDVSARYHALVKRYPPDEAPDEFAVIAAAYEAVKERSARVRSNLSWMPETDEPLGDLVWWLERAPRERHDLTELRSIVQSSLE